MSFVSVSPFLTGLLNAHIWTMLHIMYVASLQTLSLGKLFGFWSVAYLWRRQLEGMRIRKRKFLKAYLYGLWSGGNLFDMGIKFAYLCADIIHQKEYQW